MPVTTPYAYNYRYVIPQVTRYQHCGDARCARFSWVSLTHDPPHPRGELLARKERACPSLVPRQGYGPFTHALQGCDEPRPATRRSRTCRAGFVNGHYLIECAKALPASLGSMHDVPLGGRSRRIRAPAA